MDPWGTPAFTGYSCEECSASSVLHAFFLSVTRRQREGMSKQCLK